MSEISDAFEMAFGMEYDDGQGLMQRGAKRVWDAAILSCQQSPEWLEMAADKRRLDALQEWLSVEHISRVYFGTEWKPADNGDTLFFIELRTFPDRWKHENIENMKSVRAAIDTAQAGESQ